jgi:hypothetical protein
VGPAGVLTFSKFNGLACPTAVKAHTRRKRQFPELSNQAIPVAIPTTNKKNLGEVSTRAEAERTWYDDHHRYDSAR